MLRTADWDATTASRYIGSLVADFHRTLLKGGVFLYPPTNDSSRAASCGCCTKPTRWPFSPNRPAASPPTVRRRILDIEPKSIHERTPLVVGSHDEMQAFEKLIRS